MEQNQTQFFYQLLWLSSSSSLILLVTTYYFQSFILKPSLLHQAQFFSATLLVSTYYFLPSQVFVTALDTTFTLCLDAKRKESKKKECLRNEGE